jgi:hypothetical protein
MADDVMRMISRSRRRLIPRCKRQAINEKDLDVAQLAFQITKFICVRSSPSGTRSNLVGNDNTLDGHMSALGRLDGQVIAHQLNERLLLGKDAKWAQEKEQGNAEC